MDKKFVYEVELAIPYEAPNRLGIFWDEADAIKCARKCAHGVFSVRVDRPWSIDEKAGVFEVIEFRDPSGTDDDNFVQILKREVR